MIDNVFSCGLLQLVYFRLTSRVYLYYIKNPVWFYSLRKKGSPIVENTFSHVSLYY